MDTINKPYNTELLKQKCTISTSWNTDYIAHEPHLTTIKVQFEYYIYDYIGNDLPKKVKQKVGLHQFEVLHGSELYDLIMDGIYT